MELLSALIASIPSTSQLITLKYPKCNPITSLTFWERRISVQLECHRKCFLDLMQISFKNEHSLLTAGRGAIRCQQGVSDSTPDTMYPQCNLTSSTAIIKYVRGIIGHEDNVLNE